MVVDYRAYPILCVDDEQSNLLALTFALEPQFTVLTASNGEDALRILAERDVTVLLADQRMPGMTGAELCARAKEVCPDTIRMIITAFADLHDAMDAINTGEVARYIAKPWRDDELADVLRNHIHIAHLQRSVREMETRLLQTTAATAAYTIHHKVAHEIGNILQGMKASAEGARDLLTAATRSAADPARTLALTKGAGECNGDILAALEQLEGFLNRLRRGDPGQSVAPARCDAAHAVDATVRILRSDVERVARLTLVVDASPTVGIDRVLLGQVVVNLVTNASQVIEPGAPQDNEITVRVGVDGDTGVVSVSDSGPGIPEALRNRIFDAGVTTRHGGSGIGLAIVRDIVRAARGEVRAENRPEGGARFSVRLPIVAPERPSTRPP